MLQTSDISEIVRTLEATKFRLIGIDGVDGSGKSALAKALSGELGNIHVNLDDYLDKNRGQFVSCVKYDEVRRQLDDAKESIIIEGVCLLAVIENLEQDLDILIYVKRVSDYGSWRDEVDCDVTEDIDEFVRKKKEEHRKFVRLEADIEGKPVDPNDLDFPQLAEEVIRYHNRFRPHEKADIIFKRID